MKHNNDIKKIWDETPAQGILPKGTQKRMWHHISKKTLKGKPMFSYKNIAAVLLVFILSGAAVYWSSRSPFENTKMLAVKTYPQDIRLLKLPDGSRIWLNEGSEISYPEKFKEDERVVELKGEAFFDIARDTTRPFKIKSGEFTTTVLGTSFNIKAYDDKTPKVSVVSGKVRVEKINPHQVDDHIEGENGKADKKVELTKGEATIYQEEQQDFEKVSFTDQEEIAWKKSLLDIDEKSLKEVIHELKKVYQVDILYQDAIPQDYVLKGTLDIRQPINSSLKVISFAIEEIEFQQKNDSVWLVKNVTTNNKN